jgi:hypothetical protein
MKNKNKGYLFWILGFFCILLSIFSDSLSGRPQDFGPSQIALLVVGIIIIISGILLYQGVEIENVFPSLSHLGEGKAFSIKNKKTVTFLCIFLFFLFFCIYLQYSTIFVNLTVFNGDNHLFQIDARRVIGDMSILNSNHYRTIVHPIFVLLINPIGLMINSWLNDPVKSAILLNSIFGSLGVVLGFLFFINYSKNIITSFFLTLFFGFSASQLFLSVIPDSSSLAICSLILTYIIFLLSLQKKKLNFPIWILVGIFSFGVTITNFTQTLICFCIACFFLFKDDKKIRILYRIAFYTPSVILIVGFLSILQKFIYPSSEYFFSINTFSGEIQYASLLIFQKPITVIVELIRSFLLVNYIAPTPTIFQPQTILPYLTFAHDWNFSILGYLTLFYWIILLICGVLSIFRKKENSLIFIGISLCILFNFCLHSFYGISSDGIELFLYSGNFTFLILTALCSFSLSKIFSVKLALGVLVILSVINNISVMNKTTTIFQSALFSSNQKIQTNKNRSYSMLSNLKDKSFLIGYRDELDIFKHSFENKNELLLNEFSLTI